MISSSSVPSSNSEPAANSIRTPALSELTLSTYLPSVFHST
jgi:hypothetical protein